jgi:predicted dehydrogenase
MKTYKACVIGHTGRGDYGHSLEMALLGQPGIEVVAVADPDAAGRAKAAARLKVENAYADYREMLEKHRPQLVAICPRFLDGHKKAIEACAEFGAHVFCEKPLCPDLAEADSIVATCEKHHIKLAMAMQSRYSPNWDRVLELVNGGKLGEILEVRTRGKEDHRGGGEDLMVLGIHLMDLMRGLLGDASWCFARVTDRGQSLSAEHVRVGAEGIGPLAGDRIDATYGFAKSPAVAYFASSRPKDAADRNKRFSNFIYGSKGVIEIRHGWLGPTFWLGEPSWTNADRKTEWKKISSNGVDKPETLPTAGGLHEGNVLIVKDLIRAIETDTQPRVSVYDGRAALEMILAVYDSARKNAPVSLPMTDRAQHPLKSLNLAANKPTGR